jgi:processive 1,2-diacylglycerol beta-glucosyltransferase
VNTSLPAPLPESPRKPLLFLHATTGAGHARAAEALAAACTALELPSRVIDTLDCTSKPFRRVYAKTYIDLVKKMPTLWGFLYDKYDTKHFDSKSQKFRLLLSKLNTRNFWRTINDIDPAAIVCTHFLPLELLSDLKRKEKFNLPLVAVVTDISPHSFWVFPHVDRYYVASANSQRELLQKGIPSERIQTTGIPIDPAFAASRPATKARAALGLPEKPTVLLMSGGFGLGPVAAILRSFADHTTDCSLVVVAGKNAELKEQCEKIAATLSVDVRVFGFVNFIHDLLDAADFVVTKPGGLTLSEILAKGKPMMLVAPIPGQEQRNCEYLLERGAATRLYDFADAAYYIDQLLCDPARLRAMSLAAQHIAYPHAAFEIVRDVEARYLQHDQ